jgi:RND superfamily putative drug exporter
MQTTSVLSRLGGWSCRRRRIVLAAWAVVFVLGIGVGGQVFGRLADTNGSSSAESIKGLNLWEDATQTELGVIAVVDGPAVTDPGVRAAVLAAKDRVSRVEGVTSVTTAYDAADPRLRSTDGRASLMLVDVKRIESNDSATVERRVDAIRDVLKGSVPGATVKVGGDLAMQRDANKQVSTDLLMGELIALPLLLVALTFVFRGVRVALIPVLGALVTVSGALLLLLGSTYLFDVGGYAIDVVILFGIALAVDYSLLIVSRFREERGMGAAPAEAAARSAAAAGRTVTFSAFTVIASLAGLFVFGDPLFTSLAAGGIVTVLIALLAGLTLVPALLGHCAHKAGASTRLAADQGFFGRLAQRVQRRPVLVALGATAVLLAAAIPFLGANLGNGDPRSFPTSLESRQVADRLQSGFPAKQADPIVVVGHRDSADPEVASYAQSLRALPGVADVSVESGLRSGLSAIDVVPSGSVQSKVAQDLVATLRDNRPGYDSQVTGMAAYLVDFKHQIASRLPFALGLIALVTFVLLFLMTGSVLVPLKALVMNTVSLGATFGALVWVFQDGHLSGLLGFESYGTIELWVPVVVFVFAFGLSMDYEVFLLSRIKECYDETKDSGRAVAVGLQRSGRIITSAAALVIIVFLGFAAGKSLGIKEMGLALAIAVAVDATIVRCLLVPATMTLLGAANWWAPGPLRRLHDRLGWSEAPRVIDLTDGESRDPAVARGVREGAAGR